MKITRKKCIAIACVAFMISFGISFGLVRSCNSSSNAEDNKIAMVGDTVTSEGKVMEFEYENHKFINIVKATDDGGTESFVVHDPNCRCSVKKLNNITTVITNVDTKNSNASDSIAKANFRVVLSKLNQVSTNVSALRNEVAQLKMQINAMQHKPQPNQKKVVKKVQPTNKKKK